MSKLLNITKNINIGEYQCISTDKATAKKISEAFINKGWWFIVFHIENYYFITTSTSIDLNWYSKRGYKFELES